MRRRSSTFPFILRENVVKPEGSKAKPKDSGSSQRNNNRFSAYCGSPDIALKSLFTKYDENNDGLLNEEEFFNLLENDVGMTPEEAEVYRYLLDEDGDGKISFEELKAWFQSNDDLRNIYDENRYQMLTVAIDMFKRFDVDNNLSLDRDEMRKVVIEFATDAGSIDTAMAHLDIDNDGKISFQEFLKWLNWIPLKDLFG